MQKLGDLGLMGVADDEGDAGEGGNFFRGALGITAGYQNARGWIDGVDFADGVAGLGIGGSGNCAGVKNHNVGRGRIGRESTALFTELALDGCAVCLRGTAAKLLYIEGAHRRKTPAFYLSIGAQGDTALAGAIRFTAVDGADTISGFHDPHTKKPIPTD